MKYPRLTEDKQQLKQFAEDVEKGEYGGTKLYEHVLTLKFDDSGTDRTVGVKFVSNFSEQISSLSSTDMYDLTVATAKGCVLYTNSSNTRFIVAFNLGHSLVYNDITYFSHLDNITSHTSVGNEFYLTCNYPGDTAKIRLSDYAMTANLTTGKVSTSITNTSIDITLVSDTVTAL